MTDRESILAGNYKLLDALIKNRDDWKSRAEFLGKQIESLAAKAEEVDKKYNKTTCAAHN